MEWGRGLAACSAPPHPKPRPQSLEPLPEAELLRRAQPLCDRPLPPVGTEEGGGAAPYPHPTPTPLLGPVGPPLGGGLRVGVGLGEGFNSVCVSQTAPRTLLRRELLQRRGHPPQ